MGGKDIKSMEPESLMSYMSFVFQDVTLFNDTVMNNIRLGNPNATDDQVIAAAKAAYCDEFVREMPDGYQTVLGENGSTLSGGERQRISIARALLKTLPLFCLTRQQHPLTRRMKSWFKRRLPNWWKVRRLL